MGIHDTVPKGDPNNAPSLFKILKRCILSGTCNANRVVVSAQAHQPGMICTGSGTSLFRDPGLDRNKGWRMVLQKLWVSQNFSRISRVSQSRFLSGYVRLAVSFFIRRCLGVSIFCNV